MKISAFALYALILVCGVSCTTTKTSSAPDSTKSQGQVQARDLVEYLRSVPGISIVGSGSSARIAVQGMSSQHTDVEPLIVVDGKPVTGGLSAANNTVVVSHIRSVRVLRSASETAFYGAEGSSGVILISLNH